MGLWNPAEPKLTLIRQGHLHDRDRGTTKHIVFSRAAVEAELQALISRAVEQLPALGLHAEDLIYGPARRSYASYRAAAVRDYEARTGNRLIRGKDGDWDGLLGQKVPTFDNRALAQCALMPRFHAAKAGPKLLADGTLDPDSLLPAEVSFLMKLKNFRFDLPGSVEGRFSVAQIAEIFAERRGKVMAKKDVGEFKLTRSVLEKLIGRGDGVALRKDHDVIEAPRSTGRSRFSKPALKIVRRLILSGKSPAEIHAEELERIGSNADPLKGLIPSDLDFLQIKARGGEAATWENFYLRDESLAFVESPALSPEEKIKRLIGEQNNPVVRHRLETFWRLLKELEKEHGEPDHVALEFVREDFIGPKARMELARFQNERRKAREEARQAAGPGKDSLRYQLMKDQGSLCLYCGKGIGLNDLSHCHLDHIVPEESGGPGAFWNFALCCRDCNDKKEKRTPWEWIHTDMPKEWDAYAARVRQQALQLRPKKVRLLTEENAAEQVQRYQALAETAWIARLARMLVCLHFRWPANFLGGERRVVVLPGGLTARVRRKYSLNSLLGRDIALLEAKLDEDGTAKVEAEIEKKCRADKRHHALDAMVLSFLPQWTVDPTKRMRVGLPDGVHRESLRSYLDAVVPSNLCFEKPRLEESIYGERRADKGTAVATKRFSLGELGYTGINPVFKLDTLKKDVAKILDPYLRGLVGDFIRRESPDGEAWQKFCREFRLPSRQGQGPAVKSVRLIVAPDLKEFKDLSKGDKRPALRRGDKHRGYYVYIDGNGKPRVRPVYAFESSGAVAAELREMKNVAELIGFFQSGCAVTLSTPVDHAKTPLAAGTFKLNTIRADGFARVTSATGVTSEPIGIAKLIQAGLERS